MTQDHSAQDHSTQDHSTQDHSTQDHSTQSNDRHNLLHAAQAIRAQLVAWRRDIHAHPELGFQEFRTGRLVADALAEMGIEAQTGVGKTGVVGFLGTGGPVVGIRADMDALPILEANEAEYASQNPGVMHACGHDAHTAMLLGAARILAEMPERPPGQIRFLFQPSEEMSDEENKSGAVRMIEDGALAEVDRTVALHVDSMEPANTISVEAGFITAAEDAFHAVIRGSGGHGAYPHDGTDPTFMLAQVINAIHGIRARRVDPTQPAAISLGYIHAGDATNVIPAEVKLGGTMRSYDDRVRQQLRDELANALAVAEAFGGSYELKLVPGYISTHNDPAVVETIRGATTDLLGAEALTPWQPGMGAEDFSYMSREAPGAMLMLGAKLDDTDRPHHTPVFDISEDILPTGAAILAETAVRLLSRDA